MNNYLSLSLASPFLASFFCYFTENKPKIRLAQNIIFAILCFLNLIFVKIEPKIYKLTLLHTQIFDIYFIEELLSLYFAFFVVILWIIAIIYNYGYIHINHIRKPAHFNALINLSIGFTLMIGFSGNLITSFIFYEFLTLSTYLLVTNQGGVETFKSGKIYAYYLFGTSVFMLFPAIFLTYYFTGNLDYTPNGLEFKTGNIIILFIALLYLFGLGKIAIMPLHKWLPAAMVAPIPVSAILHSVAVVKSGIFLFIKIMLYIFGATNLAKLKSHGIEGLMSLIALSSMIYSGIIAARQNELKKMLAYSTINQLSFMVFIISFFTYDAIIAAFIYMIMHGINKITLFFTAGAIYTAANKNKIDEIIGIGKYMKIIMIIFTIAALSLIGLPPFIGHIAKANISSKIYNNLFFDFGIMISSALSAYYLLPIIYKCWFIENKHNVIREVPISMLTALLLLINLIIIIIYYKQLILNI